MRKAAGESGGCIWRADTDGWAPSARILQRGRETTLTLVL